MRSLVVPAEAHISESTSPTCQHRFVYLTCMLQWFGVDLTGLPPNLRDGAKFRRFCEMPSIENDHPAIVCEQKEVTTLKLFPSRPYSFGSIFILNDSSEVRHGIGLSHERGPIQKMSHRREFRNTIGPMLVLSSYLSCIKDNLRRSVEDWSNLLDVIDRRLAIDVSHSHCIPLSPSFN